MHLCYDDYRLTECPSGLGRIILLDSVTQHFAELDDPRRETANQRHEFIDILMIALCAVIGGANHWTTVVTFGRSKEAWFRTFLRLPNGIPSHDTFSDVFAKIEPEQFETCFIEWVSSMALTLPGDVVAFDGKTMRGSHDRANGAMASHIISAYSTANALVLGQIGTDSKSNEITAIPTLLGMLDLKGSLVTIDAMGCQRKIAQRIIEKGAHYLLAVKENQPSLCEAIGDAFLDRDRERFAARFDDYAEQSNAGHGRIEHRRCWVSADETLINEFSQSWAELKRIVVIESERTLAGETTLYRHWYISSLEETAENFLSAKRAHWQVENGLHWVLDVAFREDESRVRKGEGAENLSVLRRMALNLLKREKTEKGGVEAKRNRSGWDDKYMEKVIAGLRS